MAEKKGRLRVGTSGIAIPGNRNTAPPAFQQKSRLNYYSSLFDTIEINSSFYKIPMPSTFERWSDDVGEDFIFTLKLWKEITHVKSLDFELSNIDLFLQRAACIGHKKGCLLIQFPGKISIDHFGQVELILERMHELDPPGSWRKALEFRNVSWHTAETFELLHEHAATFVLHDIPKSKYIKPHAAASFYYFRFHGPKGDYRGSYSDAFLQEKALAIQPLLNDGKDVYAYFNNTAGNAYENATTLKRLTGNNVSR